MASSSGDFGGVTRCIPLYPCDAIVSLLYLAVLGTLVAAGMQARCRLFSDKFGHSFDITLSGRLAAKL